MKSKILIILVFFVFQTNFLRAQDPRERTYFYPVLKPNHENKPAINGWAKERVSEKLNRGLTAIPTGAGKVYLSWRFLADDPKDVEFNIYRETSPGKGVKVNRKPVVTTTDFTDQLPAKDLQASYFVRQVTNGKEGKDSETVMISASSEPKNYHTIRFRGSYKPQRIAVADLNGDGAFDFVIKQPERGIDPGGQPNTDGLTYKIEAYLNVGTFLWQKDSIGYEQSPVTSHYLGE